jgi:hypothetical protein
VRRIIRYVSPYRSLARVEPPRVYFGRRRRALWLFAFGLALILASTAAVVAGVLAVMRGALFHFHGTLLIPAILGLGLVLRARWGSLDLVRERGVLVVTRSWLGIRRRRELPLGEIATIEIAPSSFREKDPAFDLNLVSGDGARVRLLRAPKEAALEEDRAAIADFFREHGLLWGGAGAHARIAPDADREPPESDEEASTDRSASPAVGRRHPDG